MADSSSINNERAHKFFSAHCFNSVWVASHLLLDRWLKAEERTGQVLILAGRQRMLSERILRLAIDGNDPVLLRKACLRFKYTHDQIFGGVAPLVAQEPPKLSQSMNAILADANRLLKGESVSAQMPLWQRRFVISMELVIDSLGESSLSSIRRLRQDAVMVAAVLLVVILLQALFIFHPLESRIRKATKQLIGANRDLSLANAELEQFQFAAAHDLKEPLRTTQLYLQLLEEQVGERLDEESLELLKESLVANGRLQSMLEGIEWLLQLEGEKAQNCSGESAIREAVANMEASLEASGARLTLELDEFNVRCHRSLLVRMFQNLISNAVKYAGEKSPEILVRAELADEEVKICVTDFGVGIPEAHLEKVFEPFRRLHRQDQVAGSGLGLTFCRDLLRRIGGEIWVESSNTDGTSFHIRMPGSKK